ncbi:MAG: hypothetical protein ABJR05_05175 [Balneola sp.]
MNKDLKHIRLVFFSLTVGLIPFFIQAQDQTYEPSEERSSFELRAQSDMDANRLRASYYNHGHNGVIDGGDPRQLDFEFPKNTGRIYLRFMSVHYGTEIPNESNPNEPKRIINAAQFKANPSGSINFSLNPIIGYQRDDANEIARSDRGPGSPLGNTWPNSWPDKFEGGGDGWAGSWNGFFGRDQFNADVEFYYKTGDDRNKDIGSFTPDLTDPSRGGLATLMDTRILAWSQILVSSTHFNIFEITNDSNFDYPRMAFGLWIADFVAERTTTNQPEFDIIRSVAYLTDTDRNNAPSAFDGLPIGEMGLSFLETPGNASDGIDNDGDSDTYDNESNRFDPENKNLYTSLTVEGGGFYSGTALRDSVIPLFTITDFDERTINIGDKIVTIQDNGERVVEEYDGNSFKSQGIIYGPFGPSFDVIEDIFTGDDPNADIHVDGLDNDFDGLIDENRPNHLVKATFIGGLAVNIPVRFINYLHFDIGDTLQQGLIVPNQDIRARISSDADFADLVNNFYEGRFQNYFTSAPMVDEGRGDSFDNDRDWTEALDDVGIQGDPETLSEGKGDGKPSSGVGTTFPGESNIDKTDVSETDLIGVSRAQIFPEGVLQVNDDNALWSNYLKPGEFDITGTQGTGQDIYVSSGLFPLRKGQTERFAVAITAAASSSASGTAAQDRDQLNRNLFQARQAYAADYQFAVAPDQPILKAVPGDGKVTLYWDTRAEDSFDRYLNRITGNGNDFEGYKVYRSTDPSFEDIRNITDGFGNALYYTPIAIFDLDNGVSGFDSVGINGVNFNLGSDSGIQRFYVDDEEIINGKTYYYAVTSYDAGYVPAGIAPSESPIQINQGPDGSITFGVNVVQVRPTRSQAGYVSPDKPQATIVQGSPGGSVNVDIIDPFELKADNLYEITFEDTLIDGGNNPDTIRTQNFTLTNVTSGANDTLITRSPNVDGGSNPITEGFIISMTNIENFGLNIQRSGWSFSDTQLPPHGYFFATQGALKVSDYEIIIGDNVGFGQSTERTIQASPTISITAASVPTNFRVVNTYTNEDVEYAYVDSNPNTPFAGRKAACDPNSSNVPKDPSKPDSVYVTPDDGVLSAVTGLDGLCSDGIYLIEDVRGVIDTLTYRFELRPTSSNNVFTTQNPQAGDTLKIFTTKPFSRNDKFQFRMDPENLPKVDADSAKDALDDILVIPNPYKVSSIYELEGASGSRQQNRELHFNGMPVPSTLRIFTSSGVLIREIEVTDSNTEGENGGTYIWNMLTKDNLEIAYGIYIYHVEAKGIGNKTGKFAVIK